MGIFIPVILLNSIKPNLMKKILVLLMVLASFVSNGQTKKSTAKSFKLLYENDKLDDKEYLQCNWNLLALKTPKTGFWVKLDFSKDGDSKLWKYEGLTAMASGLGTCHENDYLIILFDDGTKLRTNMWNKFNCDGDIYLDWDKELETALRTKPIKIVRLTNGRSFNSYEKEFSKAEDKNYFITFFKKLDEFNSKLQ